MTKPSASAFLSIPEHVLARPMGEGILLLDLSSGDYFGLDPVAARIWRGLSEARSLDSIRDELLCEFDATPELLEADIMALIEKLALQGLVLQASK